MHCIRYRCVGEHAARTDAESSSARRACSKRLQEQDKRNHEAYIRSGEIFEDRQQNYEKMTKNFEKLLEWGKV